MAEADILRAYNWRSENEMKFFTESNYESEEEANMEYEEEEDANESQEEVSEEEEEIDIEEHSDSEADLRTFSCPDSFSHPQLTNQTDSSTYKNISSLLTASSVQEGLPLVNAPRHTDVERQDIREINKRDSCNNPRVKDQSRKSTSHFMENILSISSTDTHCEQQNNVTIDHNIKKQEKEANNEAISKCRESRADKGLEGGESMSLKHPVSLQPPPLHLTQYWMQMSRYLNGTTPAAFSYPNAAEAAHHYLSLHQQHQLNLQRRLQQATHQPSRNLSENEEKLISKQTGQNDIGETLHKVKMEKQQEALPIESSHCQVDQQVLISKAHPCKEQKSAETKMLQLYQDPQCPHIRPISPTTKVAVTSLGGSSHSNNVVKDTDGSADISNEEKTLRTNKISNEDFHSREDNGNKILKPNEKVVGNMLLGLQGHAQRPTYHSAFQVPTRSLVSPTKTDKYDFATNKESWRDKTHLYSHPLTLQVGSPNQTPASGAHSAIYPELLHLQPFPNAYHPHYGSHSYHHHIANINAQHLLNSQRMKHYLQQSRTAAAFRNNLSSPASPVSPLVSPKAAHSPLNSPLSPTATASSSGSLISPTLSSPDVDIPPRRFPPQAPVLPHSAAMMTAMLRPFPTLNRNLSQHGGLLPMLSPGLGSPTGHHPLYPHPPTPGDTMMTYGTRRPRDPNKPAPLKKYKCDICSKAFSRSNTLVTHRRIHTGEKPFKCEVCSRAFRQPGNLTRHRLTHTTVKPYVCIVCKKAFNRASNLHTHMRTHSHFRPFLCPYCGKSFQQKVDLKIHMYTHGGRD